MAIVKDGSWTDHSLSWISSMRAQHPGLNPKELERVCRKSYPYQQRKGWAYKAWLKAMRIAFRGGSVERKGLVRCTRTADMFETTHPTPERKVSRPVGAGTA